MTHPVEFTTGVRVLILIDRSINNTNKSSARWINKLISTNTQSFYKNLERLKAQMQNANNPSLRLYGCVNARDLTKAINLFQHRQLDIATEEEKFNFYVNIKDKFVSCLMKPESREEKLFLVDIDIPNEEGLTLIELIRSLTPIKHYYRTPKGWHVICSPFNIDHVKGYPDCEVKKDALMIWEPVTLTHS
jgi:hypothetical protein